jgi:hypothetical protein
LVVIPEGDLLLPLPLLVPAVVVVLVAVVPLVVIPEGHLLLPLLLFLSLPLSVLAVILSAAKDPGTLRTTHTARTFQPETRLQDPPIPVPSPKVTKNLSSPQVTQKYEIPNNDAPFKSSESGVVTTLHSLQFKKSSNSV